MDVNSDKTKMGHIMAAKTTFRIAQGSKTWEQRVQAIARLNATDKLAKVAMAMFKSGKK